MPRSSSQQILAAALFLVTLGAVLAVAVALRAPDASQPVMAAEDPYTHMSLVREHLRDGTLDSQNEGGALYPPGLHAFIAAWWSYSGADLYDMMRLGPVVLGLVAIAGVALLLYRWEGPLAAFAGALALATMPEVIARTTMMSPTALDLAVLPFLFVALLEVARGRLAWLAAALPLTALMVVAHPWILALVALGGFAFLLLYVLFPWRAASGPPITRLGAAAAVAVLGGALGLALATRWEASGTGFSELTLPVTGTSAGLLSAVALVFAGIVVAVLLLMPRYRGRLPRLSGKPRSTALRVVGVVLMGLLLAGIAWPAVQDGMPQFVDLPRMLGWAVLALAALAFVLLPASSSPAGHAAAGLFLATLPFAIYNPLDSPFWPHRTVVFVGLAAAMLAGVAAQRIAQALGLGIAAVANRPTRSGATRSPGLARRSATVVAIVALLPALVVGTAVAAVVMTETPAPYAGGWFRLFSECEYEALRDVADRANGNPQALIITGSWESRLVMAAFTDDADRVWFKEDFFIPGFDDPALMHDRDNAAGPTFVVVDRYLPEDTPGADTAFLESPPWTSISADCAGPGGQAKVLTYQLQQA